MSSFLFSITRRRSYGPITHIKVARQNALRCCPGLQSCPLPPSRSQQVTMQQSLHMAPVHSQHQADWAGEVRGRRTRGLSESCAFWELPSSRTRHSLKPEGFGAEEVLRYPLQNKRQAAAPAQCPVQEARPYEASGHSGGSIVHSQAHAHPPHTPWVAEKTAWSKTQDGEDPVAGPGMALLWFECKIPLKLECLSDWSSADGTIQGGPYPPTV